MLLHTLLQLQWKRSCNTPYRFFMDPLNELLNLVSHVINMCRMCFVYLTFDTAQKVVWLCNIRWVRAAGVPKISATYLKFEKKLAWWAVPSYWPTSCTTVFGATAYTAQISMHVLTTVFPGRLIFHSTDVTWLVQSPNLAEPDYCLWDYVKSKVYETQPVKLMAWNTECAGVLKGSIKKCSVLWHPFHHEHRSALNDMVVTYASCTNSNDLIKV